MLSLATPKVEKTDPEETRRACQALIATDFEKVSDRLQTQRESSGIVKKSGVDVLNLQICRSTKQVFKYFSSN